MAGRFYQTNGQRFALTDAKLTSETLRQIDALAKLETETEKYRTATLASVTVDDYGAARRQAIVVQQKEKRIAKARAELKAILI